jgi:aspartyl-tRNA(Asn)/glutamyl-tRNA(Gln) amidotransferase subunit C
VAVTPEDVRRVAELAHLGLDPDQVVGLTAELNTILDHMDALRAAPAVDLSPASDPVGGTPLRADEPPGDPLHSPPATNAPAWETGFFTVPRLASHDDTAPGTAREGGDSA